MCLSPMFSTLERDTDMTLMNSTNWECVLRRNTAAGSTSGLQIFFKQFNDSERLVNASKITGHSAVRVRVKIVVLYSQVPTDLFVSRHLYREINKFLYLIFLLRPGLYNSARILTPSSYCYWFPIIVSILDSYSTIR